MSRNYQEKALNSMFPKPVDNVEEVINKESCIDGEAVSEEKIIESLKVNPISKNDIFMKPKKRKENIVLKVEDGEKKKDRYAHLAEARKKGAETRRLRAIDRKAKKDEEKEEKQRKKEEKKKASVERNRQRARDRYYGKKAEKETNSKILTKEGTLNVKSKPINIPRMPESRQTAKEMDFNTFASHMLKYENMKQRYFNEAQKRKQDTIKQQRIQEIKKPPEYHPKNYPLSNIYNPANRKNTSFF